jgi:hypothetical protein
VDGDFGGMPDAGALCNCDSEGFHVVGWFPTEFASIPEAVLIEKSGRVLMLKQDLSEHDLPTAPHAALDIELKKHQWIVSNNGPRVVDRDEVGRWRDKTATDLVQEAMLLKGNPLRVLKILESAAKLRSLDLSSFVAALQTQRTTEDENLGSVFFRVRGTRPGGQTGG